MDRIAERSQAIAATMADVRLIEQQDGVTRSSLAKMRALAACSRKCM